MSFHLTMNGIPWCDSPIGAREGLRMSGVVCSWEDRYKVEQATEFCDQFYPDLMWSWVEGPCTVQHDPYREEYLRGFENGKMAVVKLLIEKSGDPDMEYSRVGRSGGYLRRDLAEVGLLKTKEQAEKDEEEKRLWKEEWDRQLELVKTETEAWEGSKDHKLFHENREGWRRKHRYYLMRPTVKRYA